MNTDGDDRINELAWLAFAAQQYGWDGMADRIAEDIAAAHERENELDKKRRQLFEPEQDDTEAA